jgi:hypothetical protein
MGPECRRRGGRIRARHDAQLTKCSLGAPLSDLSAHFRLFFRPFFVPSNMCILIKMHIITISQSVQRSPSRKGALLGVLVERGMFAAPVMLSNVYVYSSM